MSTKAQIQSNIDTRMASGLDMPISTHRGVLKDDTHNILDNMYSDNNTDTQSSETFWTLDSPGSCNYTLTYTKQGRIVHVTGVLTDFTTDVNNLATLNISDYYSAETGISQYGSGFVTGGTDNIMLIEIEPGTGGSASKIKLKNTASIGMTVNFSLSYLVED